jgi:hypothetical protein
MWTVDVGLFPPIYNPPQHPGDIPLQDFNQPIMGGLVVVAQEGVVADDAM